MIQTAKFISEIGSDTVLPQEYKDLVKIWACPEPEPLPIDYLCYMRDNPVLTAFLTHSPNVTRIVDLRNQQYDFVSSNTKDIMGYDASVFREKGLLLNMELLHPKDLIVIWKLIRKIWSFIMKVSPLQRSCYKFSYDYRIQKPDGKQAWILEQNSILQQDSRGNITHVLSVCTDITNWKKSGGLMACVISTLDDVCHFFTIDVSGGKSDLVPSTLSKRELEIVKLMSEGFSSKYIAEKLFISFHTVNTHRQKIIEKTHTKNTGGLVQFAICNGLI